MNFRKNLELFSKCLVAESLTKNQREFLAKYIKTQISSALQLQKEGFEKKFVLQYLSSAFNFLID